MGLGGGAGGRLTSICLSRTQAQIPVSVAKMDPGCLHLHNVCTKGSWLQPDKETKVETVTKGHLRNILWRLEYISAAYSEAEAKLMSLDCLTRKFFWLVSGFIVSSYPESHKYLSAGTDRQVQEVNSLQQVQIAL